MGGRFDPESQQGRAGGVKSGVVEPGQSTPGLASVQQQLSLPPGCLAQFPLPGQVVEAVLFGQSSTPSRSISRINFRSSWRSRSMRGGSITRGLKATGSSVSSIKSAPRWAMDLRVS